jgi:pimeloyl-ACP methyl ester carboxylesterase
MNGSSVPFVREAGQGPGVVCLHANASSSSQWRGLMELLAPTYRVLAPDSLSAGRSPAWPADGAFTLREEAAFLEAVFANAGRPFTLVGHSYGAAVALVAALQQPHRVRAMALYEPTLFSLVDARSPPPNDADGIRRVATAAGAAVDAGDTHQAAELFIDYWMGAGAWARTPASRKPAIAESVRNVRGWGHALFGEPSPLAAFSVLKMPVLYLVGKDSPPSSLAVARLLAPALPQVRMVQLDGLGHMGPVTHPERVNAAIARFIDSVH